MTLYPAHFTELEDFFCTAGGSRSECRCTGINAASTTGRRGSIHPRPIRRKLGDIRRLISRRHTIRIIIQPMNGPPTLALPLKKNEL